MLIADTQEIFNLIQINKKKTDLEEDRTRGSNDLLLEKKVH